jgi:hypothetical protein
VRSSAPLVWSNALLQGDQVQSQNSRAEDAVFTFLFCSFALLAIERTNLCDRVLYQTASTSICEFFFLFLVFIFSCYFNFFLFLFTCGEALQHPMDHVHIAVTLITMLEIVPQQDSVLTILMGI